MTSFLCCCYCYVHMSCVCNGCSQTMSRLAREMACAGAKVNMLVKEVITNTSSFERIQSDSAMDLSAAQQQQDR